MLSTQDPFLPPGRPLEAPTAKLRVLIHRAMKYRKCSLALRKESQRPHRGIVSSEFPYSWLLANMGRPPALVRSAKHICLSISSSTVFLLGDWLRVSQIRRSEGGNMFWNGASLKFLRRFMTIVSDGSLTPPS
jgi:hypothetical protein